MKEFILIILASFLFLGCGERSVEYREKIIIFGSLENDSSYNGTVVETDLGKFYLYNNAKMEQGPGELRFYNTGTIAICNKKQCITLNR